jgi:hypothetical protein
MNRLCKYTTSNTISNSIDDERSAFEVQVVRDQSTITNVTDATIIDGIRVGDSRRYTNVCLVQFSLPALISSHLISSLSLSPLRARM